jgi:hypothetical protein
VGKQGRHDCQDEYRHSPRQHILHSSGLKRAMTGAVM